MRHNANIERPKHDSWHLLGCALLSFAVLVCLFVWPLQTIGIVVALVIYQVFIGWLSSRNQPQVSEEYIRYQQTLAETNALTLDEARTAVEALLAEGGRFTTQPVDTHPDNLEQYPPSVQALFSRYAQIALHELEIGTMLQELPFGDDPEGYFDLKAPYQLIGVDLYLDGEGMPIAVKDAEEPVYTVENYGEPDPIDQLLSPSIYHYLLARVRFVQKT